MTRAQAWVAFMAADFPTSPTIEHAAHRADLALREFDKRFPDTADGESTAELLAALQDSNRLKEHANMLSLVSPEWRATDDICATLMARFAAEAEAAARLGDEAETVS